MFNVYGNIPKDKYILNTHKNDKTNLPNIISLKALIYIMIWKLDYAAVPWGFLRFMCIGKPKTKLCVS